MIRFTTIDALKDKNSPFYYELMSNFIDKINVQEEIVTLEIVKEQYKRKINDRISELENEIEGYQQAEHRLE